MREAQELVEQKAPSLQRVLDGALLDGGWFDQAHEQAVDNATIVARHRADERAEDDQTDRLIAGEFTVQRTG